MFSNLYFNDFDGRLVRRLADLALRARRPRGMGFQKKQDPEVDLRNSSLRCQALRYADA